jgi:Haem-binding domain
MQLRNLTRFLRSPAIALYICAFAVTLLPAGCSNSTDTTPQVSTNSNAPVATDPRVRNALVSACFDCHSNEKPGVWNSRLAPSYLFGRAKARQVLNFSDWPAYDSRRKQVELEAIGKVVADGSMPPGDYDFIHPGAKLTAEQKQILLQWVSRETAPSH